MADKNEARSIFDSFKFWGQRSKLKISLSADIEKSPTIMIEDGETDNTIQDIEIDNTIEDVGTDNTIENVETDDTPKDESNPSSVRLHETMSGNFIISRGWDGNNMLVYKTRRRNY